LLDQFKPGMSFFESGLRYSKEKIKFSELIPSSHFLRYLIPFLTIPEGILNI
jgi:hypothetical protein